MSNEIAIRVENLSKRYRIGLKEEMHDTFAGALADFVRRPLANLRRLRRLTRFSENGHEPEDIIWALKDVSFEVKRGEVVGVIGRNGAGKSTLLKIVSRITEPTSGRVQIHGRVSSLLEVGTGFHPELTGRDNVYLNGTILGMRKAEIDGKFDEIVDFSGVEKFIDTPVKRYSSGMQVRLAFSVAAHLEPEVLVIDEVLAVGDVAFQKKCLGKMGEVAGEGRTVLFVSHNMGAVNELCQQGIMLEKGRMVSRGAVEEVVAYYLTSVLDSSGHHRTFPVDTEKPIQILSITVTDKTGRPTARFDAGDSVWLEIGYQVHQAVSGVNFAIALIRNGTIIFSSFDTDTNPQYLEQRPAGTYKYRVPLPTHILKAGMYTVDIDIGINRRVVNSNKGCVSFQIDEVSENTDFKAYSENRPGILRIPVEWEIAK